MTDEEWENERCRRERLQVAVRLAASLLRHGGAIWAKEELAKTVLHYADELLRQTEAPND